MNKNKTAKYESNPLITSLARLFVKTCVLNFTVLFAREKNESVYRKAKREVDLDATLRKGRKSLRRTRVLTEGGGAKDKVIIK